MTSTSHDSDAAPSSSSASVILERAPLTFSCHATCRAARRNVRGDGVAYVLVYGRLCYRTGAQFYSLGARDLPFEDRRDPWAARLVGTVVVVAADGEVITTYRNRRALRRIARKMKYRLFDDSGYRDASCFGRSSLLDAIA